MLTEAEATFAETVTELTLGTGWRDILACDYVGGPRNVPLISAVLLLVRLRDSIAAGNPTACARAVRVIDALQQQLHL